VRQGLISAYSGLSGQGELNVDILDHDATKTLQAWFDERWNDKKISSSPALTA
jgi:hypothetical protein